MRKHRLAGVFLLAIGLGLAGARTARANPPRRPYAQAATRHSVVLRYSKESGGAATVRYRRVDAAPGLVAGRDGGVGALEKSAPVPWGFGEGGADHKVTIDGLEAGARYAYTIVDATGTVGRGEFETLAPPGQPIHFIVYGDNRTSEVNHRLVVHAMEHETADFIVNTGDLVPSGTPSEYDEFFRIEGDLLARTVLFPTLGNHEMGGMFGSGALGEWKRAFSTSVAGEEDDSGSARYYAIDAGNVRIVVLDFNQMSPAQTSWLDKTLAGARAAGAEHLFVAIHHGPYDSGDHGENRDARARWLPIFARHGVELIFSGHDHDYERGQGPEGIRYVVSGGGGAPLYDGNSHRPYQQVFESTLHYVLVDVAGSKVTLTARRPDGTVVDSFFFYSGEKAPTAAMGPQEPGAKSPGVEKQPVSAMASAETPGPTGCHCRAAGRAAGRPGSPPAGPFLVGMGLAAALLRRRRE